MKSKKVWLLASCMCFGVFFVNAQKKKALPAEPPIKEYKAYVQSNVDKKYEEYCSVAKDIWGYAELGYQESKSAKKLVDQLL
jgi:hypothetical protein